MKPAIRKRDSRACNEIFDGGGHQHLTRACERRDPLTDMDGDAADVVTSKLDLSGVKSRSYFISQWPD